MNSDQFEKELKLLIHKTPTGSKQVKEQKFDARLIKATDKEIEETVSAITKRLFKKKDMITY
jgi:hypothetical protein